ncbi:S1 RNA binding domain protein [Lachnoanaerobaculum saburreum F0468]|uniref:S1 RNA binding domain protein n=1 Tax=Lachnoanaerobaculum saburreum F0468 TaxID=1095750 RepID=I0R5W6_9FIRM|nr:S1 RNA binding domain protein [Lachnoanaerobaculum saburreum F0468]
MRRFKILSDLSFEQMLDESFKTLHTGEVVNGKVIDVKEDQIILNVGFKSDGIITRSEYSNDNNLDLRTVVHVGDEMEAKVLKINDGEGQVLLSYKKLAQDRGNKKLEDAFNNKEVLTGKVVQVVDGGLSVVVDDARVFIPASLVSDTFERDLSKYKDTDIEFVITEFNPRRRRIIGDRKQLLLAKKEEQKKALFEKITPGDVIEGTVKNVTDFGAFVDLGGADGLLHISEMSWGRVENPKKVFKSGEKVTAFIKDISGEKIALSMKFPDQNPWLDAEEKFARGNVVKGRVARMTDFGAFVEISNGVDALLHVSQISHDHVEKPSDVLKVGDEVEAVIVEFNEPEKKISLSIKALTQANEELEKESARNSEPKEE